ncbi:DUF3310 domain-containing protein [Convivina praedatoris]|uniref:DUF3310 domain-containing protein n=1 Tax=Convivina praedatoris TaxID=2880963 RepID=UPI002010B0DB|nr:DUF3310 domain-containing protein [Convivina sp. LMG 32447]CAH1855956.1 hypothetical protein R078138_01227 [Convivina sp. LMG 32447]
MEELVRPQRYVGKNGTEVFDIIDEWELNYYQGNVVKYLIRHRNKGGKQDLEKALVYLRHILTENELGQRFRRLVDFEYLQDEFDIGLNARMAIECMVRAKQTGMWSYIDIAIEYVKREIKQRYE